MNTNHTNSVHRSVNIAPRPEGKVCTAQGSTANEYPAPDESERVLHKVYTGRAELVTSPAIKDGAYDQETIEISTNERSVILRLGSPDEDHRRAKFALDRLYR